MTEQTGAKGEDNPPAPKRLLAGKYESEEDLEHGYLNLVPEIQRTRAEADAARREADAYREMLARHQTQEPETMDMDDPAKVASFIDQRIEKSLRSFIEPLTRVQEAKQRVAGRHNDFREEDVLRAINQDPDLSALHQRTLGTDPEAAYELGYQAWKAKTPVTKEQKPVIDENRRRDAGVPKGTPGEVEAEGLNEKRYQDLLNHYRDTGDYAPFVRERFKGLSWFEELGRDQS